MAQWRLDNRTLGQPGNRFEVMMIADEFGNIVNLAGTGGAMATSTSAFGEPLAVPLTPVVQLDAIYGEDFRKFYTNTENGGQAVANGLMTVSTGTSANGIGILRSRRAVRYRPGQGAMTRFTAMFSEPQDGYLQLAGFQSEETALCIGYHGTRFGILRRNLGRVHIHQFTITGAPTGTETVTVTLDGVDFTVNVSGTTQDVATTLGNASYGSNWRVEYANSTLYVLHVRANPRGGVFALTTQVGGTLTATAAVVQPGVAHTDTWVYQEDWNYDTLDGQGRSQLTLDPQTLNVYQIDFRWLGAGEMRFAIENSETGDIMYFHHEHYSNRHIIPHLQNPSLQIGYLVRANTVGGANVSVSGASILGAIEGIISPTEVPTSVSVRRSDTMSTGSVYHVLSVHNRLMFQSRTNEREAIIKTISAGATTAASAPAKVSLYLTPTYNANLAYYPVVTTIASTLFYSNTTTTINVSAGTSVPVFEFYIASGSPQTIDVSDLRLTLWPGAHFAAAISSSSNIQVADVSLTILED